MALKKTAAVVGSGPNGLVAAITLAGAGVDVTVYEANPTVGGGARSAQLTLSGFVHDVCSAVYPLGAASPVFQRLDLQQYGLQWIHPGAPLAHPLDDGTAIVLERSIRGTARQLGGDERAYQRLMQPLVGDWDKLSRMILRPILQFPRYPWVIARFGTKALMPARLLALTEFRSEKARALFAGLAAHSTLSLDRFGSASFGLVLGILAHVAGWPVAKGGSQNISSALAAALLDLGGKIGTGIRIDSLEALSGAETVLLDITPRQFLKIAGDRLPESSRRRLARFRYGPGAFKLDYALDAPLPWKARECLRAGTIHLGGTLDEIAKSEREVTSGHAPERPFVILTQPTLFDETRAPAGAHTAWAYCHVPNGSTFDMTQRIEAQIERFAPGFASRILARSIITPGAMELRNANCVGGDINGGLPNLSQMFTGPSDRIHPYRTALRGVFFCSSSTPPGGGVHGMCGHNAAIVALRRSSHG